MQCSAQNSSTATPSQQASRIHDPVKGDSNVSWNYKSMKINQNIKL